jgi:hypothetical protein
MVYGLHGRNCLPEPAEVTLRIERDQGEIPLSGAFRVGQLHQVKTEIARCGSPMVLHLQELDLVDLECVCFLSACESAGASILRVSPQVENNCLDPAVCDPFLLSRKRDSRDISKRDKLCRNQSCRQPKRKTSRREKGMRHSSGIKDKVVVITGASSGIGEATALLLAERSAKVGTRSAGTGAPLGFRNSYRRYRWESRLCTHRRKAARRPMRPRQVGMRALQQARRSRQQCRGYASFPARRSSR